MTNTKKKDEVVIQPILPKDMELLQYKHQTHVCITRSRLTVDQLQDDKTWAFAAQKLRMFDRVEVMDAQGSQFSKGIVTYCHGNSVRVQIYANYPLNSASHNEITYRDYIVRWGGIDQKWVVVGIDGGKILKQDFPTDNAALKYLEDHYKALTI